MISTVTIISGTLLLLLAVCTTVTNPFFPMPTRKNKGSDSTASDGTEGGEPLSVIMLVNGNESLLVRNLPLFLDQEYAPGFHVTVVGERPTAEADDLMKQFGDDPRLSYTFIPDTSRYISREKLGITLGVKAASNEWCVLVDSSCRPTSKHWLQAMGSQCTASKNLVIGYNNYDADAKPRMRFYRLRHFARLWRECRKGTPYCSNGTNLAFRKSEFISGDGFRGNLDIIRGEFDFTVNKLAQKGKAAVVTSHDGSLTEEAPTSRQWRTQNVFFLHSCRHMQRTFRHRLLPCLDLFLLHFTLIASLATAAVAAVLGNYILLAAALVALVILIAGRVYEGRKAINAFHADVSAWRILPLELTSAWHSLADRMRYMVAKSTDFTCHKL